MRVDEEAVIVTSPGGIHVTADPTTLGIDTITGVRNNGLVRIAGMLRTPGGARIVEHTAAGIAHADSICHQNGNMPALFVDDPSRFSVVLLRHSIDASAAQVRLGEAGVAPDPVLVRLVSVLMRLEEARATSTSQLGPAVFDARFCARVLAPCRQSDSGGSLEHARTFRHLATQPSAKRRHVDPDYSYQRIP